MIWTYPEVPLLQQDLISSAKLYYPNKDWDFSIGRNNSVNNVRIDLWEGPTGTYVFPTTGIQMQVVSSSANDTLAGTGAQKVHIHYLDSNYNYNVETINMNGLAVVNTVATNIFRINGFHVVQVGTVNGSSAGNISIQSVGGAVTYGYISAGYNTARQAIYTIPAGKTGYISHWQCGSGTSSGQHFTQVEIRATCHKGIRWPGVFLAVDVASTLNSNNEISFGTPIPIPEKTDVKMSAISDSAAANAVTIGAIMGWVE